MTSRVWAKNAKFDTLRLGEGSILPYLGQTFADRGVVWVVDVDVSTRARVRIFNSFVAISFFLLVKGNLNCLFLKESTLYVISFFLSDRILAWTWIAKISLFCKRSSYFISPKVASGSRAHKWIHVLVSRGRTRSILWILSWRGYSAEITSRFVRKNVRVMTRTWPVIFNLDVFAVWHLWKKNTCVSLRVESLFVLIFGIFVVARTGVLFGWVCVFDFNCMLKDLSHLCRFLEIAYRSSFLLDLVIRVVQSRSNRIISPACIHISVRFFWGDRSWLWHRHVYQIFMLVFVTFFASFVQVWRHTSELQALEVSTRTRIC